jgi:hypothetical protein
MACVTRTALGVTLAWLRCCKPMCPLDIPRLYAHFQHAYVAPVPSAITINCVDTCHNMHATACQAHQQQARIAAGLHCGTFPCNQTRPKLPPILFCLQQAVRPSCCCAPCSSCIAYSAPHAGPYHLCRRLCRGCPTSLAALVTLYTLRCSQSSIRTISWLLMRLQHAKPTCEAPSAGVAVERHCQ